MIAPSALLLIWSMVYAAAVLRAVSRRIGRPAVRAPLSPLSKRVLLIRPCAGAEPELRVTLRSSIVDGSPLLIRFAVESEADPAAKTAHEVARKLVARGHDALVCITGARGPNRKADQIARVLVTAPPHDVVAIADSDVLLAPGDLARLVRALDDGAAAAWSPPIEEGPNRAFGDVLSRAVLGATLHAFPLLAAIDPAGLVGKLIAIRRDALEAIGSFASLTRILGEDMEIARRLHERGQRIVAVGVARARSRGRSAREAIARYARWIGVIRSQRPLLLWTYPAFFFGSVPAACVAWHLGGVAGHAAAGLFLGARIVTAFAASHSNVRRPFVTLGYAVLGDLVLALAFARALTTRTIAWRGESLRVGRASLEARGP